MKKSLISAVTSKYQTTIPTTIREVLGLKQGDQVAFEVDNGKVHIRKVQPIDIEYLSALTSTLDEWNSNEDEEAYRDL